MTAFATTSPTRRAALVALLLAASAGPARGDGASASAPDGDSDAAQPGDRATHDMRQRWAIRGCPVELSCRGELARDLAEFERRTFPRGDDRPWIDGANAPASRAPGTQRPTSAPQPVRPSQLRPDLPWLDTLTMPDIPFTWDERIIRYLEFFKDDDRGQAIMRSWLVAQGRYRSLIEDELKSARLPLALLYVSMIESSYDPNEYSRAGASGLWQFMPAGGQIYGLRQSRWLDERNDPVASTRAVVHYFRDLHDRFGDWQLALTAFNAGYGAVLKAIARYNTNDLWQLLRYENALPWESSNYAAKALAAAIVGENRAFFGFGDLSPAPALTWDEVEVSESIPLAIIARAAGVSEEAVVELNPQLRLSRTPPGMTEYTLRIPAGHRRLFAERLPQLAQEWTGYSAYTVKRGERFEDIATVHGLSRSALRELNGLRSESEIRAGVVLLVPTVDEETKRANRARAEEDLYASGEPKARPGEKLLVPVPDPDMTVADKKRWFYRVVAGDTQYGVATAFGVDRHGLASWNGLDPEAHLHPRMVLQVWADPEFDPAARGIEVLDPARLEIVRAGSPEHLDRVEHRMGRKRVRYRPKRPESLESIGERYGLTKWDMSRINDLPPNTVVQPEDEVLVYEVVDSGASERAAEQAAKARK